MTSGHFPECSAGGQTGKVGVDDKGVDSEPLSEASLKPYTKPRWRWHFFNGPLLCLYKTWPELPLLHLSVRLRVCARVRSSRGHRLGLDYFPLRPGNATTQISADKLLQPNQLACREDISQSLQDFVIFSIVEMNTKIKGTPQYSEELAIFQKSPHIWAKTRHVRSSQRSCIQNPLRFTCVEHEYS